MPTNSPSPSRPSMPRPSSDAVTTRLPENDTLNPQSSSSSIRIPSARNSPRTSPIRTFTGPPAQIGDRNRRRSSIVDRFGAFGDAGGVNSFNNFARSWQRAASFREITSPGRRPFIFVRDDRDSDEEEDDYPHEPHHDPERAYSRRDTHNQLLKTAIAHDHRHHMRIHESPFHDDPEESDDRQALLGRSHSSTRRGSARRLSPPGNTIFEIEPQLASPFGGSYFDSDGYGTITPRIGEGVASKAQNTGLFPSERTPRTDGSLSRGNKEAEPLVIRRVESSDGRAIHMVIGHSTVPQTIFNSANVLIGVGMLSLPLAVKYTGWIVGLIFFTYAAISTSYTSKLLAKCLDQDPSLITFGDLAYVSFGRTARVATSLIFTLELFAACVALVVLFADSLNALIPAWSILQWKIVCGLALLPLCLLPLRWLSFTSILGIMTCIAICLALVTDGVVKQSYPGSLRDPAPTSWFPMDWRALPLALGLFMAPWGGQSVFPNIYRDMRHPKKYNHAVNVTYIFTYILEGAIAVVGYLMFGNKVLNEVTSNIFKTKGYPRWISVAIAVAIAIIPLTKIPLSGRPIVSTVEVFCNINEQAREQRLKNNDEGPAPRSPFVRMLLRTAVNVAVTVIFVIIAILVPSFERIMALLGSFACFTVCLILPCAFHLRIFAGRLSLPQRILNWSLIISSIFFALTGTVCSFLPKKLLGVES